MSDVADNIGRIAKKHPTSMEITKEDALNQIKKDAEKGLKEEQKKTKKLICRFEKRGD